MTPFASPYDGYGRAPLRATLALVAGGDLIVGAFAFARTPDGPRTHPMAPMWLKGWAHSGIVIAMVCAVGAVSLVRFAMRPARARDGWVGLAVLALMIEGHAAMVGGPMRSFFASGATLLGWLLGLAFARASGTSASKERQEMVAEAGAVAALSAVYVGACLSKVGSEGVLRWLEPTGLRELIYAQQRLGTPTVLHAYGHLVGEHAIVASALAAATLIIQASAAGYGFTPRTRAVIGTLLLLFHINVWLLTPILFAESIALLVVFSYPWPRWTRRPRVDGLDDAPRGPHEGRAALLGMATLALALGVTRIAALHRYTHLQHRPEHDTHVASHAPPPVAPPPPLPSPETIAMLDGLTLGAPVLGPWHVSALHDDVGAVDITLERVGAQLRVTITPRGARTVPPPRRTLRHDLFYSTSTLDDAERDGLLDAVAARVQHAETTMPSR